METTIYTVELRHASWEVLQCTKQIAVTINEDGTRYCQADGLGCSRPYTVDANSKAIGCFLAEHGVNDFTIQELGTSNAARGQHSQTVLFDVVRTDRTYATRANAVRALQKVTANMGERVPYVIAVNEQGRFCPVVVGAKFALLAHHGITVVG